jgi:hypothetical protein
LSNNIFIYFPDVDSSRVAGMTLVRSDYVILLAILVFLSALSIYWLWTASKTAPPQLYQTYASLGTIFAFLSGVGAVYTLWKFATYRPPERPFTPTGLRPVQVTPAYVLFAVRRAGRRPEEFMVRGGE